MGYQTDFVGYLYSCPPLGARERSMINRISGSPFLQKSSSGLRVADPEDEVLRELLGSAPRAWVQLDRVLAGLLPELRRT